jgi:hypothetical protein
MPFAPDPPAPPGTTTSIQPPTDQKGQHVIMLLTNKGQGGGQTSIVEFDLNPEAINIDIPSRISTTQTVAGVYQDNWGPGVGRIQLAGTTGWRQKTPGGADGFTLYQKMRALHESYQALCAQHDPEDIVLQIVLPPGAYSHPDHTLLNQVLPSTLAGGSQAAGTAQFGFYQVSSDRFSAQRNKGEPLLFRYTWELTILRDELQAQQADPSQRFVVSGAAGSSDPAQGGGNGPTDGQPTAGGSTHNLNLSALQQQAAAAADLADTDFNLANPQTIRSDGRVSLADLAQNYGQGGMTVEDIQVYNQALLGIGLDFAPADPLPPGITIGIPDPVWVAAYHQALQNQPPQS